MHELIITRGPARGTTFPLDAETGCTIGSGADDTVRVGGDAPPHAVTVKALKGGGFGAKQLAGELRLNGEPVAAARLAPGDLLEIGDTELRYETFRDDTDVPRELGGFRIGGVLGKGGMGTVYRARQLSLDREVALKVLSRERTSDPEFVGRFQAEARHAARLHHPNVVQVFDVDRDGDLYFYSMELMEGGSLETRLRREGRLSVEDTLAVVKDAAKGLAFAEQMRIVHRDIKPDNLMIDRHGHVKLADLGLAHAGEDDDRKVVGTPHFMSPEQILRQPMDQRSDLYALGCTMFRLITGETPFSGDNVKAIVRGHVKEPPPRADDVVEGIPPRVADVIDRLLAKDPDERFQSADELVAELERLQTPELRRGPWVALAIVAVLAAGGALYWALSRPETKDPERIVEYIDDPDAERTRAENLRLEAEAARLAVLARRIDGEELASELERIAREHAGTPAAEQAAEQAASIRERLHEQAEAEARRQRAIERAIESLRSAFRDALDAGDLAAALGVLDGAPEDAAIADAAALDAAREALRKELRQRAAQRLDERQAAVDDALAARDPDAAQQALAEARAAAAWPDELLGDDPQGLETWLDERQQQLSALRTELREAAEESAWQRTREALLAPSGPLDRVARLDLDGGAEAFAELAARESAHAAGAALQPLVAACRTGAGYLERYRRAVEAGSVQLDLETIGPVGEPDLVVAYHPADAEDAGDAPAVTVRSGERRELVETRINVDVLRADPLAWFPALDDAGETAPAERAAFVACVSWCAQTAGAARYLADLDVTDDASGTGDDGFTRSDEPLRAALELVAPLCEPVPGDGGESRPARVDWAPALHRELQALRRLGRALRALSARRNTTAAGLTAQLLESHDDTATVSLLR